MCPALCCVDFFFFFQAEDGIRDGTVTGVQTCALPICQPPPDRPDRRPLRQNELRALPQPRVRIAVDGDVIDAVDLHPRRSEERRVGKECRSRWSPHHEKKKKYTEWTSRSWRSARRRRA